MTVIENLKPRVQYDYNKISQYYPIIFPYIERQYIKCMVRDQLLTYNVHYTVPVFDPISLDRDELYLKLLITPDDDLDDGITIEDGDLITIYRETPIEQQTVFPQNAKFSSQKVTEVLDKIVLQQQEQQDDINRCLKLSKNVPDGFDVALPVPAPNEYIRWSEDGNQLINYDLDSELDEIREDVAESNRIANLASDKADTAISTANSAVTTAGSALSTANDAFITAGNALVTSETAETNSEAAINIANTSDSKSNSAVDTANTALLNSNTAMTAANNAVTTANNANTTSTNAVNIANSTKNKVDGFIDEIEQVVESMDVIAAVPGYAQSAQDSAAQAAASVDSIKLGGQVWVSFTTSDWTLNASTNLYEYPINTAKTPAVLAIYKGNWYNKNKVNTNIKSVNGVSYLVSPNAFNGLVLGSLTIFNGDVEDTVATEQAAIALNAANSASASATNAANSAISASEAATLAQATTSSPNISTIINNLTPINTVATNIEDVNDIADNLNTIEAVNNNASNINAVNANKTNIDLVANGIEDISDVITNLAVIEAVNNNASNINAVNANKTNIDLVANDISNIEDVANDLVNIDSASTYATSASNSATLSQAWASQASGLIDNTDYSAKYYAAQARESAEQAASGQIQSDWEQTDNTKKDYIKNKPTIPSAVTESTVSGWGFTKNTGTITGITMNGTSKGTSGVVDLGTVITQHQDISDKEDKAKPVITLANSGTLTLADNTAYKIENASGAITFTLPTVTDLTVLHRIEIELNMSTAQTIDLGLGSTPNWFNETEPDLSTAGTYNILYQYSPSKSAWYCGGAKIGSAA